MSLTLRISAGAPQSLWWYSVDEDDLKFQLTARDAAKDFNTLSAAGNTRPNGLWSDGTTMWVIEDSVNNEKIYAYNLATKARDSAKDFDTLIDADNDGAASLWSDGTTMWVSEEFRDEIYAYNLSTKARDPAKDFDTLDSEQERIQGIWSDGTTMWAVDLSDRKIYAYNLSTKARDSAKDFDTLRAAGVEFPLDIWSDGTTMWVAALGQDKLYAFNLSTKARDASKEFNTLIPVGNTSPAGLWSDGTTMWIADQVDGKLYAYDLPSANTPTVSATISGPTEVTNGGTASYSISVGGTATGEITYLWQSRTYDTRFVPRSGPVGYSSWPQWPFAHASTESYSFSTTSTMEVRREVRCAAIRQGVAAVSNVIETIHLAAATTVTASISGPTESANSESATFTVTAGGTATGTISYQWERRTGTTGTWANTVTTASYIFTGADSTTYQVRCTITRDGVTVTSDAFTTAWAAPTVTATITREPEGDGPFAYPLEAVFSSELGGNVRTGSTTYQWEVFDPDTNAWVDATGTTATTDEYSVTLSRRQPPRMANIEATLTTIGAANTERGYYATFQYANNAQFHTPTVVATDSLSTTQQVSWTQPYGRTYVRGRLTTQSDDSGLVGEWSDTIIITRALPKLTGLSATRTTISATNTTDSFYVTFQYDNNTAFSSPIERYDTLRGTTHTAIWNQPFGTTYIRGRLTTGASDTGTEGEWSDTISVFRSTPVPNPTPFVPFTPGTPYFPVVGAPSISYTDHR